MCWGVAWQPAGTPTPHLEERLRLLKDFSLLLSFPPRCGTSGILTAIELRHFGVNNAIVVPQGISSNFHKLQ